MSYHELWALGVDIWSESVAGNQEANTWNQVSAPGPRTYQFLVRPFLCIAPRIVKFLKIIGGGTKPKEINMSHLLIFME